MKKAIHNALVWIDVHLNYHVYVRQMLSNGFFTADSLSRHQIYTFFKAV